VRFTRVLSEFHYISCTHLYSRIYDRWRKCKCWLGAADTELNPIKSFWIPPKTLLIDKTSTFQMKHVLFYFNITNNIEVIWQ